MAALIDLADVTLDDKYTLESRPHLSERRAGAGAAAAVQRRATKRAGLNTAGFISGYRGSPLGGSTSAVDDAQKHLDEHQHPFPARRQRGPRRHRGLGHAAGQPVPGRQVDGVFAHLVRQRPGRRSLRRRAQARQRRGHLAARRRAGRRRRRSRLPSRPCRIRASTIFEAAMMPVLDPGDRSGHPRFRPARLGDVALFRLLGRLQSHHRDGRLLGLGRSSTRPRDDHHPERFRDAAGGLISAGPIRRSSRSAGCTGQDPAAVAAFARANGLDRVVLDSPRRAWHRHHRQGLSRRAAGAGDLGIDDRRAAGSASASTRSA